MISPVQDTQIELSILDRTYKLACPPAEVDALRAAGRHLDQKMRDARKLMPRVEAERIAVMVALELCQELMQANRAMQSQAACQRLVQDMIAEVKQAVAQNQG